MHGFLAGKQPDTARLPTHNEKALVFYCLSKADLHQDARFSRIDKLYHDDAALADWYTMTAEIARRRAARK
jgi:hypothetical protein